MLTWSILRPSKKITSPSGFDSAVVESALPKKNTVGSWLYLPLDLIWTKTKQKHLYRNWLVCIWNKNTKIRHIAIMNTDVLPRWLASWYHAVQVSPAAVRLRTSPPSLRCRHGDPKAGPALRLRYKLPQLGAGHSQLVLAAPPTASSWTPSWW